MSAHARTLDDRFTDLADALSEGLGKWYTSVLAALAVAWWTLYCAWTQGNGWWYGTFYNLPLNLITTVAELFIGFLLAAATNRAERRNRELIAAIHALQLEQIDHSHAQIALLAQIAAALERLAPP